MKSWLKDAADRVQAALRQKGPAEHPQTDEEWLKPVGPPRLIDKQRRAWWKRARPTTPAANAVCTAIPFPVPNAATKANRLRTTKYSVWTFLPKNILLEQFRRIANIYFAAMIVLQAVPALSSFNAGLSAIPLVTILLATAVKDGIEDWRRHQSDNQVNFAMATILRHVPPAGHSSTADTAEDRPLDNDNGIAWMDVHCQALQPGDIVRIVADGTIPADVILLQSSDSEGLCYVETRSLDGETNLKLRQAPAISQQHKRLLLVGGLVTVEAPTADLYAFSGTLRLQSNGPGGADDLEEHEGSARERLKAGDLEEQEDPARESTEGPAKESASPAKESVDSLVKDNLVHECAVGPSQLLLRNCILRNTAWVIGVVAYTGGRTKTALNAGKTPSKRSLIERRMNPQIVANFGFLLVASAACAIINAALNHGQSIFSTGSTNAFVTFWSCLILFQTIVPISLYITVEVCKTFQAYFIHADNEMVYTPPAPPSYSVLRDGDGGGAGGDLSADARSIASSTSAESMRCIPRAWNLSDDLGQIGHVFTDKTGTLTQNIMRFLRYSYHGRIYDVSDSSDHASAEFLRLLALCHSVLVSEQGRYQSQSPDETAILLGCHAMHCSFVGKRADVLTVRTGSEQHFRLLETIGFTSARKRMSVFVQEAAGDGVLMICKGADSVVYERIVPCPEDDATMAHLQAFAEEGLRTLCFATKRVERSLFDAWAQRYRSAVASQADALTLDALADEMEQGMRLEGATAIEDKLQEGVPETIGLLRASGIRVWMLTGDKVETAMNVAFASSIMTPEASTPLLCTGRDDVGQQLLEASKMDVPDPCLVIDGDALAVALERHHQLLLHVAGRCESVVCCRVSPRQKAQLVQLVKRGQRSTLSLAIGDGANDVNMLQTADVGVGISGLEGMQAVMSADYAVAQFRFLSRLLFFHGRNSHLRTAKATLASLYKNVAFVAVQMAYQWSCAFTAQYSYDWVYMMFFNALFTVLPVLALGILDREPHISRPRGDTEKKPEADPFDYRRQFYTNGLFAWHMLEALYHAAVCYGVTAWLYADIADVRYANDGSLLPAGNAMALSIILAINGTIALMTSFWTWLTAAAHVASLVVLLATTLIVMLLQGSTSTLWTTWALFWSPRLYLALGLTLPLSLAPRAASMIHWRQFRRIVGDEELQAAGEGDEKDVPKKKAYPVLDVSLPRPPAPVTLAKSKGRSFSSSRIPALAAAKSAAATGTAAAAKEARRHEIINLHTMQHSPVAGYAFAQGDDSRLLFCRRK